MTDNVLPSADETAVAGDQQQAEQLANPGQQTEQAEQSEKVEKTEEAKPEKTPEQRALARAERKIDRLVRQREELRAQLGRPGNAQDLRQGAGNDKITTEQEDADSVSLSRAELQRLVREEAAKLAPTIKEQQAEIEQRQKVVQGLAKSWGQEKFDTLAADLDDAFGGLVDAKGQPKPATDAIFEADDPASLIEYLADPDHADEAEAIARMSPIQAGRAIAKLESTIAAAKAEAKPKPSKAAAPLEPIRGDGKTTVSRVPTDPKAYMEWANKQYGRA